jgi:hypothetical protein
VGVEDRQRRDQHDEYRHHVGHGTVARAEELAEDPNRQGLLLPGQRFNDHYLASLDARGLSARKEHPARAVGMWERIAREAEAWPGTALISHELFAAATTGQAAAALDTFEPGTEVHVVLTARDLVRQIPAEWQEHVKHRSTKTMSRFVDDLRDDTAGTTWFWRVQDFGGVVERWGATLPAERVHVVTVPPPGADPETLWRRFATLLGLDPDIFDTTSSRANTSLGVEQAELLRRVNLELGDRVKLPGPYPLVVKNVLAHRILAARKGTPLSLDADATDFAIRRSEEIAEHLATTGVDIVGDLGELVPERSAVAASLSAPTQPSDEVLLDESLAALAGLLTVMADRRAQRRYEELVRELKHRPVRFLLHRAAERPLAAKARRLVRRRTPAGDTTADVSGSAGNS